MKNAFHIYIASCVPDGGIYHFQCEDGKLKQLEKTDVHQPMYLEVVGDRLYAVLNRPFADSENSGVCWWKIAEDGSLYDRSEVLSTEGQCGCHLTVFEDKIYVANYISGSVAMLPDGKLSQHQGSGPHPTRQSAAHAHFVGMTPDGKFLLAVDLGTDTIYVYSPELVLKDRVNMPAGHGCRHLAWSADGKYAFCANELTSTVSTLSYDGEKLSLLDTASALPEGCNVTNTAAAIRVVGDKVFVSNRGCDNIAIFTHKDGVLSAPEFVDVEGKGPRDFYIHGGLLLCTNEKSDNVSIFDCREGNVQSRNLHFHIPQPLCAVVKDIV